MKWYASCVKYIFNTIVLINFINLNSLLEWYIMTQRAFHRQLSELNPCLNLTSKLIFLVYLKSLSRKVHPHKKKFDWIVDIFKSCQIKDRTKASDSESNFLNVLSFIINQWFERSAALTVANQRLQIQSPIFWMYSALLFINGLRCQLLWL